MLARIARRLRCENGFGLIELTIALTMLAVGISALGGLFVSGHYALRRASQADTAAVLADKLLERFRAETWSTVSLSHALVNVTDSTYRGDSAYSSTLSITDTSGSCSGMSVAVACNPSRAIPDTSQSPAEVAPDGRLYRLDSYVNWGCSSGATPDTSGPNPTCSSGGLVKSVTVVVRDNTSAATLAGAPLYRVTSTFDRLSGGSMPTVTVSGTGTTTTATTTTTTTTTPSSPPSAPTAVALANGGGSGSTYIDTGNLNSLSFDVTLPSTSVASDVITLIISDGNSVNDIQQTTTGTTGAGLVHFTGINGQVFADGTITVSATAKNSSGTSSAVSTTATKDTTAPNPPTSVSLANGQGTGNAYVNSSNASAVSVSVGLDGNSTNTDSVSVKLTNGASSSATATAPATTGSGTATVTGVNASLLGDGTLTASATASDAAGNTSAAVTTTFTKDATAPVPTIVRAAASPTNASSLSWTVTFGESVTSVSSSSFGLSNSGLGGTPAVTSVTGSGASYTVTASTGSGSGTLGLNLLGGTTVKDAAGNTATAATGATYTLDRTPPTATITRSGSTPTNAATVSFTVTFSETVSGVTTTNFTTAAAGGVTGTSVASLSGSSPTYTVVVNTGSGDGTLGLNLSSPASVKDNADNSASSATGPTYTIDHTAPTLTVTTPTAGATGVNAGGPFTGTASDTTTVTVEFCQAASWTCGTTPTQTATATLSAGTWTLTLSGASKLGNNKNYTMRVKQTDAAGNAGTSATRSFHT